MRRVSRWRFTWQAINPVLLSHPRKASQVAALSDPRVALSDPRVALSDPRVAVRIGNCRLCGFRRQDHLLAGRRPLRQLEGRTIPVVPVLRGRAV